MDTGTKISAAGHILLIGWALAGGVFDSEPRPFEVREVSMITAEDFAALSAPRQAPDAGDAPDVPRDAPEEAPAPEAATEPDPAPATSEPAVPPEPEPDTDPAEDPVPAEPDIADIADVPPVPVLPEPETPQPPETPKEDAQPRPSDRVAPEAVAEPPPDALPDPVEQEQVAEEDDGDSRQEPQQATAPEAAADRIVPETGKTASVAPLRSVRPPSRRPAAPRPRDAVAKPKETAPRPAPAETGDAVESALAEALGGTRDPVPVPAGPPMSAGERDALREAVSKCWNVGSLSSAALNTTVVVGVRMKQDGRPDTGSIRMLSSSGGDAGSARQAYEAARRAIIRCGSRGYDLPAEKFAHWRDIEMTFNPERMRIK